MATIYGTNGPDYKVGTTAADLIYGYDGNDSLNGKAGNDQIWGGAGKDTIYGDLGNDILRGDSGDDIVYSGAGNDITYGGIGNDILYGDAGTDTVKGEAGNDIIKGGTGISYLYGGDGTDTLYYDPTTSPIRQVTDYFYESILDGGAGTDTLNVFNHATYTDAAGQIKPATTIISMNGYTTGEIFFWDPVNFEQSRAGSIQDVEKITVTGAGRLEFYGSFLEGFGTDITGTAGDDVFVTNISSNIMRGGAGNDEFHSFVVGDAIVSNTNDADRFYFHASIKSEATITGFNGAGVYGGDRIYFDDDNGNGFVKDVQEIGDKTVFHIETVEPYEDAGATVTVDKIGLVEGVDYFFI